MKKSLAERLHCDVAEAERVILALYSAFPRLREYVKEQQDYIMEHEVTLIFIDQNIGENFTDLQLLHHKLRKIRPHVDMLIVYNENKWDNSVAVWSIQSRCSDYICKSAAAERFQDALQNIWFNPIEDTNLLNLIN